MDSTVIQLPRINLPAKDHLPRECCGKCRFWQKAVAQNDPQQGMIAPCQRFPPTIVLAPNVRPLPGQGPVMPALMPQPAVPQNLWCGEFRERA